MREEVFLLGRILYSLVFIGSGVAHLTAADGSAAYAASKGVPNAKPLVQLTGALMIAGAAAVILGVWLDLAGLLLAILVVVYGAVMHPFWKESDAQAKQGEMTHFMKNLSIAGGGLFLAVFGFADVYTLTDGVF